MAVLSSPERSALPDSAFAYIEPGHKGPDGKTPDKYRHFPIHDAAHVRNALARIAQGARFGKEALPKVRAAAKKFGVDADENEGGRSYDSLYPERRFVAYAPEIRSAEDGPRHITGYASVFNKLSRRLGGFHERVNPTAFESARAAGFPGVVCRYNHRDDMVLGTTDARTCTLSVDETGLSYDVLPPQHRSDVLELVERGDVRYSSFAFRVMDEEGAEEWGVSEYNYPLRTLHGVELVDVAPVLDPAYKDTSAAARSIEGAVYGLARWVEADVDEVRSYMAAGKAIKFFKRTDRPSVPKLDTQAAAERDEARVLDDRTVALRAWKYAEPEVREEEPAESDELRALREASNLCRRYVDGAPCAMPDGHDGDHEPLCWGQHEGFPCARTRGHGGDHEPVRVSDAGHRNAESTEEVRTLSGPAALAALLDLRAKLTDIDGDEAA